jgi:hypothetical protein
MDSNKAFVEKVFTPLDILKQGAEEDIWTEEG